ncbi:MAG: peptidoglycan DD-metalloendopeptidase family protein [Patescibacteria group bacterium]
MIFSEKLMSQRIGYANLNIAADSWLYEHEVDPGNPFPFTDPDATHEMVRAHHHDLGIDWSYGGWMENRDVIRRGTYLEKNELWLHTGIDLNVEAGTQVLSVADSDVVYVGDDTPLVGGWGKHVIAVFLLNWKKHALLYAHLGETPYLCNWYAPAGTLIGSVGTKKQNGFWRPHLHLQLFADIDDVTDWEKFSRDMDGYVKPADRALWVRKCPDPTPLIFR